MKTKIKKPLALFLAVIMLLAAAPLTGFDGILASKAVAEGAFAVGDLIEYGRYPQSKVTDEDTVEELEELDKEYKSYNYYIGTGSAYDGKMEPSDCMLYADIDVDNDGLPDYRAVKIDDYRPSLTGYTSSTVNARAQYNNGYRPENIYYFKFEPIVWRILDPEEGLVMTEKVIDSQAYNSYVIKAADDLYYGDKEQTYYANDYYNSSIRKWLNDDFYNTAFTASQKSNIRDDVELNNDCYDSSYTQFNSKASKDKIFLLSYEEATNSAYGFDSSELTFDVAKQVKGTDYAKSQGLWGSGDSYYKNNAYWWLRSSYKNSRSGYCADYKGGFSNPQYDSCYTDKGVLPACRISDLNSNEVKSHAHSLVVDVVAKDPTCTEKGATEGNHCTLCNYKVVSQVIPALPHDIVIDVEAKDSTCTESGTTEGKHCTRCDYKVEAEEIPALPHNIVIDVAAKDPTCTESGTTEGKHCTLCNYKVEAEEIPVLGHTDSDGDGKCDTCGVNLGDGDGCICHKGNIFSKIIRLIYTILSKILPAKKITCCDDMEYWYGEIKDLF